MGKKSRYGVILDAGSSGTRLHIYKWKDPAKARHDASKDELQSLPEIKTKKHWTLKIRPGVSTFAGKPEEVGPEHLRALIDHALENVPKANHKDTPVFLMATAGMRLLKPAEQDALTSQICSYLQQNTEFYLPDCGAHVQVIPGETEGLYGWLASNYLLGGFDHPEKHMHGKGHHTYGFLDMGGASAQIAFAPNATEAEKHANDLKLVRLRTLNGDPREYKVFTATWLGFGVNQARENYVKQLVDAYAAGAHEIPDGCMPKGLRTTLDGKVVDKANSKDVTLVGTGKFDECLLKTYPLLGKHVPCEDDPCLLNGQHVPAIDFDVNHFIGVSEYWHTTHGVFGMSKGDKAYDFATYQKKVRDFCNQDWVSIESTLDPRGKKDAKNAQEACFKASWLINVLHEGIGIPRIDIEHTTSPSHNSTKAALDKAKQKGYLEPFQPVDTIDGIEVSWTLGKMLLYAAGQVPPKTQDDRLPVGFGSNVAGTPPDFQYAGSKWTPVDDSLLADDDDDDWGDTAEDLIDKAKSKSASGFFIFILILIALFYFLRRKDSRKRVYGTFNSLFRRSRRPGSPKRGAGRGLSGLTHKLFGGSRSASYERVMEEGEASQFELGDVDSSDNEHSDGSEGSSQSRLGRSSGLATPKLNIEQFDTVVPGASALDRSGLVVRTESRERLVPSLQMLSAGRRSRASSPTRMKSPLMTPLQED
ncbi:Golgi apyrase [Coniochaeta hoffmannii]|uniref:Golgi apyrase n=1 Tax=Coniochaeta hoffmannii TaxID=91930 RepID=A0AA38RUB2_9PEZI|nr:Golgi apyrase [Coniochaeta hoffmannii]